jgi:hypothetical protein
MTMTQPGLDDRHRAQDGKISKKHGSKRIGTLRQTYGANFAKGEIVNRFCRMQASL